jgi:hypothetical protein
MSAPRARRKTSGAAKNMAAAAAGLLAAEVAAEQKPAPVPRTAFEEDLNKAIVQQLGLSAEEAALIKVMVLLKVLEPEAHLALVEKINARTEQQPYLMTGHGLDEVRTAMFGPCEHCSEHGCAGLIGYCAQHPVTVAYSTMPCTFADPRVLVGLIKGYADPAQHDALIKEVHANQGNLHDRKVSVLLQQLGTPHCTACYPKTSCEPGCYGPTIPYTQFGPWWMANYHAPPLAHLRVEVTVKGGGGAGGNNKENVPVPVRVPVRAEAGAEAAEEDVLAAPVEAAFEEPAKAVKAALEEPAKAAVAVATATAGPPRPLRRKGYRPPPKASPPPPPRRGSQLQSFGSRRGMFEDTSRADKYKPQPQVAAEPARGLFGRGFFDPLAVTHT